MFEEASRWFLQLVHHHVVEDCAHCVEALCSLAQVVQSLFVQKDLLDDEGGHCLRKLGPSLHNPQAQGDDLCLQQETNHIVVIHLNQGSNHTQRGESQVFKGPSFAYCVQKRIQKEWDMGFQEKLPSFFVRCHTLQ